MFFSVSVGKKEKNRTVIQTVERGIKLPFTFGINMFFYTGNTRVTMVNTNAMVTQIPFSNTMLKNTIVVRMHTHTGRRTMQNGKRIQMFINLRLIPNRMHSICKQNAHENITSPIK